MKYDDFGQPLTTEEELFSLLYQNPTLSVERFMVDDPWRYNSAIQALFLDMPHLSEWHMQVATVEEFDQENQRKWRMPESYFGFDVKQFCLDKCVTDQERERVIAEYEKYEEFDIVNLLRFLKYMVDTLREHKVVWGVGRGSSVASYILYLLGVHKIDSLKFDIPMGEFLK
jgi:DNA polymerase III alpha subunit